MTTGIEVDADGFDDFGRRVTSTHDNPHQYPPAEASTISKDPIVKKETKEEAALRRLQAKYAVLSFPTSTSTSATSTSVAVDLKNQDNRRCNDNKVDEYRKSSSHNGHKSTENTHFRHNHNRKYPRDTRDTNGSVRDRDTRGHNNNAPRTRSRSRSRSRDTHRRQQQSTRGHSRDNRSHTSSKYGDNSYRR